MTELLFPGGICRVDPSAVWNSLASWLDASSDREACARYVLDGIWLSELRERDTRFVATSKLSLGDAVANALQIAAGVAQ